MRRAAVPTDPTITIPGVELERELGRGAFSVVFRGTRGGQPCAVKVAAQASRSVRWFRREAAVLARVQDPALPRLMEVGEANGLPYLVMELVDGETLAERRSRGPVSEPETLQIAAEIARALDAVHRRGLVHRDIKPRNIVLDSSGRPRLVDFGFATSTESHADGAGTRRYGAPEQFRIHAVIDRRADLYSLGRVIADCVTTGPRERPIDPEGVRTSASEGCACLVEGLLAPEPEQRYPTAAAVGDEIARILAGETPRGPKSFVAMPYEPLSFVAREAEYAELVRKWSDAIAGEGQVVVVWGPRGSGKSRLARELRVHAKRRSDATMLYARCEPAPWRPFSALSELLDQALPALGARLRFAVSTDLFPIAGAISPAFREILGSTPSVIPDGTSFSELAAKLFEGVLAALGPTLISIDDAQWLDASSAEVLARVAHLCRPLPVLVLLASRVEVSTAIVQRIESMLGDRLTTIELAPLRGDSPAQLVEGYLGTKADEKLIGWVARVADGTPLGFCEVLEAMFDAGALEPRDGRWLFDRQRADLMRLPGGADALVSRRVNELAEATRSLLCGAALLGGTFNDELAAAALGVGRGELCVAIEEGQRSQLIEAADGGCHRFVHDCVREALLALLDDAAKRDLHQRIAEQLDKRETDVYLLASHFLAGHSQSARTIAVARAAGEHALTVFDNDLALHFLEGAHRLLRERREEPDSLLLASMAEAKLRVGAVSECVELFERALAGTTRAAERARILGRVAWAKTASGRMEQASGTLARAFGALGSRMPDERPRSAVSGVVELLRGALPLLTSRRAEELEALCELHWLNVRLGIEHGRPIRIIESGLLMRQMAMKLGTEGSTARGEALYGLLLTMFGARKAGRAHLHSGRSLAKRSGSAIVDAFAIEMERVATIENGEFDRSLDFLRLMLDRYGHWLELNELCVNVHSGYFIEAIRGRPREALAWLERALIRIERQDSSARIPNSDLMARCARAMLACTEPSSDSPKPLGNLDLTTGGMAKLVTWGPRARLFLERGDFGEEFDSLIKEFSSEGIRPRFAHMAVMDYYTAIAAARIEQCLGAPTRQHLSKLAAAIHDLRAAARRPLFRAHLHMAEGYLAWFHGDPRKAREKLSQAEALATKEKCVAVLFGVARGRAHMLRREGRWELCRIQADLARSIGLKHGLINRVRRLERELEIGEPASSVSATFQAPASSQSDDLAARILRAAASSATPELVACAVLDEVLSATNADRGLFAGPQSAFSSRRRPPAEWTCEDSNWRALVEEAKRTGIYRAKAATRSVPTHAIALPLLEPSTLITALYLEREAEPFQSDEIAVLVGLSQQLSAVFRRPATTLV
jgi:predicted Ser/Thr protein kinase